MGWSIGIVADRVIRRDCSLVVAIGDCEAHGSLAASPTTVSEDSTPQGVPWGSRPRSRGLIFCALPSQDAVHAEIPFVARILVHRNVGSA